MKKQVEKLKAIHEAIERREQEIEMLQGFWQQWDAVGSREQMQKINKKIENKRRAINNLKGKARKVAKQLIKEL